jgi:hypothetical protein
LGDFFTNSSGHPESKPRANAAADAFKTTKLAALHWASVFLYKRINNVWFRNALNNLFYWNFLLSWRYDRRPVSGIGI